MGERPAAGWSFGGQTRQGMAVTDDAVSTWFIREIIPLEANLMRYLQQNWRNPSDIADLRQEVYVRVFEAAQHRIPENPKHFLLVCARNLLIDRVRREQVVPMETFADLEVLGQAADEPGADQVLIELETVRRLESAFAELPPRTREAISLAYFEGLSRGEIAKRMGVTHRIASRFVAKGIVILGEILFGTSGDDGKTP